jgi:hypothetical protein
MHRLAGENWLEMGSDSELVVLSMGLALRDISAVHFVEGDDFPNDFPEWVKESPFVILDGERIMGIWSEQLPAEKHSADVEDPKGKKKAKAGKNKQQKRKTVTPVDESLIEETQPS